jgi:lipopolysaccharide/colanic/teichoic acid biosynthesis glycosyltransferase
MPRLDTKRLFDAMASAVGLIVLAPCMVPIAAAVRLSSPGPILFRHERVGRHWRRFKVLKFRTMRNGASGREITAGGDSRVTSVGRFLRRTKLDEIPQLWNVVVGDMSLVGPRPEVERYVEMFRDDYREILKVRPGITDLAAIEYRHEEDVLARAADPEKEYREVVLPAKIVLYHRYIANQSLWMDLTILAKTMATVLVRA